MSTKTPEQIQAAIEAIRSVCRQHGVVLLATCASEGIYGEITILPDDTGFKGWPDAESAAGQLTNAATADGDDFVVTGIGDLRPESPTRSADT